MYVSNAWKRRWRSFLGMSPDVRAEAVEILGRLHIEESQHATRFTQQAQKMRYPQFRAKLLEIAADESRHAAWIAEKINLLGGSPPAVPRIEVEEGNTWQFMLDDLEEHRKCAAELLEEIRHLHADLPGIADMLQRIYDEGAKHRHQLREMLMRSDPQALMAA
jgi:bacterioferritin (cytochrome b1)